MNTQAKASAMQSDASAMDFLSMSAPRLQPFRISDFGFRICAQRRHRIKSTLAQRMTPRDPFHREPQSADRAVALHRFNCVFRTRGMKPTTGRLADWQERLQRREHYLIGS